MCVNAYFVTSSSLREGDLNRYSYLLPLLLLAAGTCLRYIRFFFLSLILPPANSQFSPRKGGSLAVCTRQKGFLKKRLLYALNI